MTRNCSRPNELRKSSAERRIASRAAFFIFWRRFMTAIPNSFCAMRSPVAAGLFDIQQSF
jgi:hypothetical protein